jgi:cytochrome c553
MIGERVHFMGAAAGLMGCILAAPTSAEADAAAGKRQAEIRCVPCHSSSETIHSMLPLLEGQPKAYFMAQWHAFRERKRTAPGMVSLAAELREDEVNNLAEYYAAQSPPRAAETSGSDVGRALADRLRCADCHGPTLLGTNEGAARLAGQKARYTAWSLQLMRSGNRSHGTDAKPDPLIAGLSNADIDALAAHFESLR